MSEMGMSQLSGLSDYHYGIKSKVFRPNDTFKMRWDLVIMIMSAYNCFIVPVDMAFEIAAFKKPLMTTMNHIIDFVFFIDILICFRTSYINEKGIEVTNPRDMAWNYMKTYFVFDLLATIPI